MQTFVRSLKLWGNGSVPLVLLLFGDQMTSSVSWSSLLRRLLRFMFAPRAG